MSKWINCNTCVPDYDIPVLIYIPSLPTEYIKIGQIIHPAHRGKDTLGNEYYWAITDSDYLGFLIDEVTHWMPCPDAPGDSDD